MDGIHGINGSTPSVVVNAIPLNTPELSSALSTSFPPEPSSPSGSDSPLSSQDESILQTPFDEDVKFGNEHEHAHHHHHHKEESDGQSFPASLVDGVVDTGSKLMHALDSDMSKDIEALHIEHVSS